MRIEVLKIFSLLFLQNYFKKLKVVYYKNLQNFSFI